MSGNENPCLSLAIARLSTAGEENFAIWVLNAPYPGGYVLHQTTWSPLMTQTWLAWQEMFSLRGLPHVPLIHHASQSARTLSPNSDIGATGQTTSYSSRLMQRLGIDLWAWLFEGPICNTLAQSQGIAIGQNKPLRLRLEIRDPDFIPLPWEIMQPMTGKQAISLSQQLLFSRTTSDVDLLKPFTRSNQALNILLVLGQDVQRLSRSTTGLQLEQEAAALANVLKACGQPNPSSEKFVAPVACNVETLLQPTPAELIDALEKGAFNILFYAGHGEPGPDGGLLFLRSDALINGTELAQVLVRTQVTLAVFNACWGAQPDQVGSQTIPRSSLAEVLIHHGVPAVLGMRDSIADQEALTFIQTLAQALATRMPIDQAVAVARQQLLTIYKFNQPAWSLPVLYMHPQFEGELIKPIEEGITELPSMTPSWVGIPVPVAYLRSLGSTTQVWRIRGGLMRVGRRQENDLVIQEQWVSQHHAEIICRDDFHESEARPTYFLRDFSRYGTLILAPDYVNPGVNQVLGGRDGVRGWQKIHHQEVPLQSGIQLKFGSSQGQTLEFVIEASDPLG
ncbi:CHAT domain-containing protein [Microcoleus sp. FACHB-53]|nr:CHAT domain-containing protein [Microcoleus sp. FACHB-53]